MNRQTKRLMKKQEEAKKKASAAPRPTKTPAAVAAAAGRERTKPRQFVKEVWAELRKVAWPSRQEVVAYSIVVLVSVIVIAAIIFGLDSVFTQAVLALFGVELG